MKTYKKEYKKHFAVYLTNSEYKKIKELSKKNKASMSEIGAWIIQEYLNGLQEG